MSQKLACNVLGLFKQKGLNFYENMCDFKKLKELVALLVKKLVAKIRKYS